MLQARANKRERFSKRLIGWKAVTRKAQMSEDIDFYTSTMAKIYADQGHFEKAAEIYRFLLKQKPDRQDLIESLSEVERKSFYNEEKDHGSLVSLFVEWFDLALCRSRLRALGRIQKRLDDRSSL